MAVRRKQFRVHDSLYSARQSIKHNAHAYYHEDGGEGAAGSCARRQVSKADGGNRLGRNVKTVQYRPAFQHMKHNGSKRDYTQHRQEDQADSSTAREKETETGC